MHAYIFLYFSAAGLTDFVPKAIHNPVAIKLLVSGLLTGHICYVHLFFYTLTYFVFVFLLVPCKSCHFNILLTEAGVMHEAGYVYFIRST